MSLRSGLQRVIENLGSAPWQSPPRVKAKHCVCSTNNSYFKHPDEEAMARVIKGSDASTLWFNYDTPQNRLWDSAALKTKYGYRVNYPDRAGKGVTISL